MATKITGTVSGEPLIEVEIGGVYVPWKQGIDNWASVTAVTGSPQSATYTDADGTWKYYRWTGNGSVTLTAGVVDALLIGGGSGGVGGGISWVGGAGSLLDGVREFTAGTFTVTVGAAGPAGGTQQPTAFRGGDSKLGPYVATGGDVQIDGVGYRRGTEAWNGDGFGSAITGTTVYYGGCGRWNGSAVAGKGYGVANSGSGAYVNEPGAAGVVIIRVPSRFALV